MQTKYSNRFRFTALLFSMLLCLGVNVTATHIIGGELQYRFLYDDMYEFTVIYFQDCYDDVDQLEAKITLVNLDDGQVKEEILYSVYDGFVDHHPPVNPCLQTPEYACIRKEMFQGIFPIPNSFYGWEVFTEACCRSAAVLNIEKPLTTTSIYYAMIPGSEITNSSPYFLSDPPTALCADDEFVYDHSAFDPDGDLLLYSLCNPKHSEFTNEAFYPFENVIWEDGFSAENPIPSEFPFTIDPFTGIMTGHPNKIGSYVYSVCYDEYRKGIWIGTGNRDFMFTVAPCDYADPIAASIITVNERVQCLIGNQFQFALELPGAENARIESILWEFGDETFSNELLPKHRYAAPGVYQVQVFAQPVDPSPCNDGEPFEFTIEVEVLPNPEAKFELELLPSISGTREVVITNLINAPGAKRFDMGDGHFLLAPYNTPVSHTYSFPGNFEVQQVVSGNDEGRCSDTMKLVVEVEHGPQFFAPNAFSPNGDGKNDHYLQKGYLIGEGEEYYHLEIFNRWGEKIYETHDLSKGWDGRTNNGEQAIMDVYLYRTTVMNLEGEQQLLKGKINLIR